MTWHNNRFGEKGVGFDYVVRYDKYRYSIEELDAAMEYVNTLYPRSVWKHDFGPQIRNVYYRITDKARFTDFFNYLLGAMDKLPKGRYFVPHRIKGKENLNLLGFPIRF